MRRLVLLCFVCLSLLLTGCEKYYSWEYLKMAESDAYEAGYERGYKEAEFKYKEAYREGYDDALNDYGVDP